MLVRVVQVKPKGKPLQPDKERQKSCHGYAYCKCCYGRDETLSGGGREKLHVWSKKKRSSNTANDPDVS